MITANYSLIGTTSNATINGNVSNQLDKNARLGGFEYYGGNTKVYPLLPGSSAIDSGCGTNATDQRGVTVSGVVDTG